MGCSWKGALASLTRSTTTSGVLAAPGGGDARQGRLRPRGVAGHHERASASRSRKIWIVSPIALTTKPRRDGARGSHCYRLQGETVLQVSNAGHAVCFRNSDDSLPRPVCPGSSLRYLTFRTVQHVWFKHRISWVRRRSRIDTWRLASTQSPLGSLPCFTGTMQHALARRLPPSPVTSPHRSWRSSSPPRVR